MVEAHRLRSALLGACREVERDFEAAALAGHIDRRATRAAQAHALRMIANADDVLHLILKELHP